jgi:hypothetical protein
MKRLAAGLLAFGVLGMQGGAQEGDATVQNTCRRITEAEVIATQNRINTYFHRGVVPRLLPCWSGVAGRGTVAVTFEFARRGDLWIPGASSLRSSSVDDGELALRCLQAAVAGTAFPAVAADASTAFTLNWSFPVPWPRDMNEVAARFSSGSYGSGTCGGTEGPIPMCKWCYFNTTWHFSYCAPACVGFVGCNVVDQYTCQMPGGQCATGSVFGNIGGVTMY